MTRNGGVRRSEKILARYVVYTNLQLFRDRSILRAPVKIPRLSPPFPVPISGMIHRRRRNILRRVGTVHRRRRIFWWRHRTWSRALSGRARAWTFQWRAGIPVAAQESFQDANGERSSGAHGTSATPTERPTRHRNVRAHQISRNPQFQPKYRPNR